ncbi:MAG: helicase-related protein [Bacteroidota bacterium]
MAWNDVSPEGRSRIVAVLGPTNTGKTHLAMERMLGHASGMIGFPLRLLARENYDRAVRIKGEKRVALITGEEKIVPPEASWFLCTVESMPVDRRVAFLGVDEIQMCADPDRGHLFTDRLLHARGEAETMLMGAETIRPLLRRLIPDAEFVTRPRFSSLTNAGQCKLSRLPPRTAVVAFSAADVYSIAELVRRQRGGAALVLGALSPRTRNAQVAIYQAGEVDYLVATDAIGMGLNMHVDHVAFAATRKFDGRGPRALTAAEMAQIAGRAGRYTKDGSFGATAELGPLDPELAERIESHQFDPLTTLEWRNSDLRFVSLAALKASLARLPNRPGLVRARAADDELALAHLALDEEIARLARGAEAVRLLWDVCCIPDFGKVTGEGHARLLAQIFHFLVRAEGGRGGRLPTDWVARQVDRINRTDGDIETLMQRIAGVRTWTYVAHRSGWLHDAEGWQQRTRAIEDKLSDALHQRLIQRFVDRRTASLVGRMQGNRGLNAVVDPSGEVHVEGHFVGVLDGFRFAPDPSVTGGRGARDAGRSVTAAAVRALGDPIRRRIEQLEADVDDAFTLDDEGGIRWRGALVARLRPGKDVLAPRVEPLASDLLGAEAKLRVVARLTRWLRLHLRRVLAPLFAAGDSALSGPARGLLFQTAEALGSLPRRRSATQIAALAREDRRALAQSGLRLGRESLYYPGLLKPEALALRALLWSVHGGVEPIPRISLGRPSLSRQSGTPRAFYEAVGYRVLGERAFRVDIVEQVSAQARRLAGQGTPASSTMLVRLLDCGDDELAPALAALGYRLEASEVGVRFRVLSRRRRPSQRRRGDGDKNTRDSQSPFAALEALRSAR